MQTITTGGYGDFAPIETEGQMVGMICMITGVICIALVVIVIGGNFEQAFSAMKKMKENKMIEDENARKEWKAKGCPAAPPEKGGLAKFMVQKEKMASTERDLEEANVELTPFDAA